MNREQPKNNNKGRGIVTISSSLLFYFFSFFFFFCVLFAKFLIKVAYETLLKIVYYL